MLAKKAFPKRFGFEHINIWFWRPAASQWDTKSVSLDNIFKTFRSDNKISYLDMPEWVNCD